MHKKYRSKINKSASIFGSWWFGVALMLVFIAGLAFYQYSSKEQPTKAKQPTNVDAQNNSQGVAYGVVVGAKPGKVDIDKRVKSLDRVKNAEFTHVRLTVNWHITEPEQGKYNWTNFDGMMRVVKKSGLKPILLANTTPEWARNDICNSSMYCPPEDPAHYAKFLAYAADRYKDYDVAAWEIWNEENGNNFWKPRPNPDHYAALLRESYTSIKQADPNAVVLVGGLSGDASDIIGPNFVDPRTYLTKLYAAGIKGYFDGLAYHPYVASMGPLTNIVENNGWIKMNTTKTSIRSIMAANGDAEKKIWITEFGVPTGGKGPATVDLYNVPVKSDHLTVEAQAELAQSAVTSIQSSPWIQSFIWYTDIDDTTAAHNTGAAYGIWRVNGEPKPVLKVLQKGIRDARNKTSTVEAK